MGTNYYLRIPPTAKRKKQLKKAIDNDNYSDIVSLVESTYQSPGEYNPERVKNGNFGLLHLGKRSGGWRFLWNIHVYKQIVKVGKDYQQSIYEFYNDYTPKGIYTKLKSFKDAYIVDEYNIDAPPLSGYIPQNESELVKDPAYLDKYEHSGQWTIEGFMQMATQWGEEYTIDNQYTQREDQYYYLDHEPDWHNIFTARHPNAIYRYGDYWLDNMRFASTVCFS